MKLRALIVDDEPLARARVRKLLAQDPEVEIAGESGNGPDAIAFIRDHRPDLVFLDVQMPEVSGFDVLRALPPESWPAVVFVTAHDQHAVEAFEIHAVDYLLKPFTQARLLASVQRVREALQTRTLAAANRQFADWLQSSKPDAAYLSRITVKNGTQTLFIRVEDVDYIESAANYVVLHTRTENHILRDTLSNLEAKFPPRLFLRISRSVLLNLDRVKGIKAGTRGEYLVVLHDGRQLLLTRGVKEIKDRLEYPGTQPAPPL